MCAARRLIHNIAEAIRIASVHIILFSSENIICIFCHFPPLSVQLEKHPYEGNLDMGDRKSPIILNKTLFHMLLNKSHLWHIKRHITSANNGIPICSECLKLSSRFDLNFWMYPMVVCVCVFVWILLTYWPIKSLYKLRQFIEPTSASKHTNTILLKLGYSLRRCVVPSERNEHIEPYNCSGGIIVSNTFGIVFLSVVCLLCP